jgi:hypothetical protein
VHGSVLSINELEGLAEQLCRLPLAERRTCAACAQAADVIPGARSSC